VTSRRYSLAVITAVLLVGGLVAKVLLLDSVRPAGAQGRGPGPVYVAGQYIIVFKDSVADPGQTAREIAQAHGLSPGPVYTTAIKGFATSVPEGRLAAVARDPHVKYVERDQVVTAVAQTLPRGINRIDAEQSLTAKINGVDSPDYALGERVNVDIAIIDTGIQPGHPDLSVAGGQNFTSNDPSKWADGNGHGTHVAGTAAALDNGIGVVGVAPGARLWSVRVLGSGGSGQLSWVIKGVDWVTDSTKHPPIEVANMSLGAGNSPALNAAITNSVAAGVTYVVAAGNDGADASGYSPANNATPGVITVSAIADADGQCGGDTLASFSNYGSVVDLAAPGVNILSTYKASRYTTLSGTSMASPHVAGTAALYKVTHPTASPADIESALKALATPQSQTCQVDATGRMRGGYTTSVYAGDLVDAGGL
jgi:subtilisin